MWQHFESVCHPSGEQGEADHGRLLQCALLQFLSSFCLDESTVDSWRQRRISPRQNAPSLKLQQRRTQQLDDMKGFPGPKSWSRLGSLCSSTPFFSVGFLQENGSLGSPLRTQVILKKQDKWEVSSMTTSLNNVCTSASSFLFLICTFFISSAFLCHRL